MKHLKRFFFLTISVVFLDQLSKWLVINFLSAKQIQVIPGFVFLNLKFNSGIIFGLMPRLGQSAAWIVISLVIVFVIFWFANLKADLCGLGGFMRITGLSLITAGILGNLFDRVFQGAIIDFIDFRFGSFIWPTFNLADLAIVLGVGFVLFNIGFFERGKR